jgi:acyl dehydratase
MIEIPDLARLRELVGRELAVSDWMTVTQERIAQFADATGDHQWIHLDAGRAARESPYGTTVAHGFLTLSLLSPLMRSAVSIGGLRMTINYGCNRVRFVSAVPAGSRIRARITPLSVADAEGGAVQTIWNVVVEREGADKPCVVAEWVVRYYPGAPTPRAGDPEP